MSTECRLSRRTVRALVPAGTCRACVLWLRWRPFHAQPLLRAPDAICPRCGIDRQRVLSAVIDWLDARYDRGLPPEPAPEEWRHLSTFPRMQAQLERHRDDLLCGHADPGAYAMAELERMREPA